METGILLAQTIAILILTVFMLSLLRAYGDVLRSLRELTEKGSEQPMSPLLPRPRSEMPPARDIVGSDIDGSAVKLAVVGRPHNTLLAFLSSGCLTCRAFWEAIDDPGTRRLVNGRVVVVTKSAEDESPGTIREMAPRNVQTLLSSSAWSDYGVPGSPYFVYVDGSNGEVVGEGSAVTWEQVLTLMDQASRDGEEASRRASKASQLRGDDDVALAQAGLRPDDPSLWGSPAAADSAG